MFDKERFEEALTKAIDESATPNDAAVAMQNLIQQTMQKGAFGQFSPMDAVFMQQAMQKAQAQLVRKMQSGGLVPPAQSMQPPGVQKQAQAAATQAKTTAQNNATPAYSQYTTKGNVIFEPLPGGLQWIDDNHVEFGSYPQTKDGGINKIVWRVLENKNGELLLVSKQVLDCKQWHDTSNTKFPRTGKKEDIAAAITAWEHCDLRKWLNDYFYNHAFNNQEKLQIVERLNTGNGAFIHKGYNAKGHFHGGINDDICNAYEDRNCRDTRDKVFLLNVREALDYFKKGTYIIPDTVWLANIDRDATATEYIIKRAGLRPFDGEAWGHGEAWDREKKKSIRIKTGHEHIGSVKWWLRNIGYEDVTHQFGNASYHGNLTATVHFGAIYTGGSVHFALDNGIRPAILIKAK